MAKETNKTTVPLLERRRFLQISGGALVAMLLTGCDSGRAFLPPTPGGPGPLPGTPPTGGGPAPLPIPPVDSGPIAVRPEVKLLPADGSVQIVPAADGTLLLRGAPTAEIKPGSVLVSAAGAGLLRKVTAVRPPEADGSVVVETVQGTLEDVFVKAQFSARIPLGPEHLATNPAAATRGRDTTTLTNFEIAFKSNEIMDTTEFETNIKGKLKIEMELDGNIEDGAIQNFICAFNIQPEIEGEFIARKKFSRELIKHRYLTLVLRPIVFAIGPIPVVIVPQIDVSLEVVGAFEGGVSFTCAVGMPMRVGAVYTSARGWDGIGTADITGNLVPKVNAFATFKGEFNPARVDVQAHLYGVAGPEIALIAPSFEVEFGGKEGSDSSVKFGASVAAKANVSVEVDAVGKEVKAYKKERALEVKWPLYEKTFLPGTTNLEVN